MDCKNCEYVVVEHDLFCCQCGAPLKVKRLTVGSVFREFSERYFSFDNKFLTTILTLLKNPELVVNGYINGLRIRYINPISFLFIAVTLSGIQIYLLKNGYLVFNLEMMNEEDAKIPFEMKEFYDWIYDHQSLIMFLSIPFLALVSKIVFLKNKNFNYAEHNLIYFYTYSFITIFSILFLLPFFLVTKTEFIHYSYTSFIVLFCYHVFALKRIFKLNRKQILLKSLLFFLVISLLYLLIIVIATVCIFIYMISTGQMNPPK
jgi:hypothetical protein